MLLLILLLLVFNCLGALAVDPDLRIVGGHPVSITERPFQVVLYRLTPIGPIPDCGGTIVNRRWIVTAAHCVKGITPDQMIISAGSDDLDDADEKEWFKIERSIPHELFDQTVTSNDIALLKTTVDMKFSPKLQPITVRMKSPKPSVEAVVSGFGVTEEGATEMSSVLQEVAVKVLDRDYCVELLARVSDELKISDTHFCAANLEGGQDACQGDSGGPITIGDSLAGVVSWGVGCAEKMIPAFYTDVSLFVPWIEKNIKKYSRRSVKKNKSRVFTNKGTQTSYP